MPIRRMRRPAADLDVCDQWDGSEERLAEMAEFAGQDLTVNGDGSVTVALVDGECSVQLGWRLYRREDGRLGVLSAGAADDLEDLPAA